VSGLKGDWLKKQQEAQRQLDAAKPKLDEATTKLATAVAQNEASPTMAFSAAVKEAEAEVAKADEAVLSLELQVAGAPQPGAVVANKEGKVLTPPDETATAELEELQRALFKAEEAETKKAAALDKQKLKDAESAEVNTLAKELKELKALTQAARADRNECRKKHLCPYNRTCTSGSCEYGGHEKAFLDEVKLVASLKGSFGDIPEEYQLTRFAASLNPLRNPSESRAWKGLVADQKVALASLVQVALAFMKAHPDKEMPSIGAFLRRDDIHKAFFRVEDKQRKKLATLTGFAKKLLDWLVTRHSTVKAGKEDQAKQTAAAASRKAALAKATPKAPAAPTTPAAPTNPKAPAPEPAAKDVEPDSLF
jgi:hypothetical protein